MLKDNWLFEQRLIIDMIKSIVWKETIHYILKLIIWIETYYYMLKSIKLGETNGVELI